MWFSSLTTDASLIILRPVLDAEVGGDAAEDADDNDDNGGDGEGIFCWC